MQIVTQKSSLFGTVDAIPSKSYLHRMLVCAMLSKSSVEIVGSDFKSADVLATRDCLTQMGCRLDGTVVDSTPQLRKQATLNCDESGSTLRFLLPVLCALNGDYRLTGSEKLLSRPIVDLVSVLVSNGANISVLKGEILVSGELKSGVYTIAGNVSSQFISGLLLALPLLNGDSEIRITTPLASKPYVNITVDVMKGFGVSVLETEYGYFVAGGQKYCKPCAVIKAEGDWSNAAFWIVGAMIAGSVQIDGLTFDSCQGDKKMVDFACKMGAKVKKSANSLVVERNLLNAIDVDVDDNIDLVPILAVACAYAKGTSVLRNVSRLTYKESDRITSIINLISSLGGQIKEEKGDLIIKGTGLYGGEVLGFGDHRIVMSAMIAGLVSENSVSIDEVKSINKSYPTFMDDYQKLGGKLNVDMAGK